MSLTTIALRFNASDWPAPDTARFFVQSAPDALGRQTFSVLWWTPEGKRRGQVFHGRLAQHVAQARREGAEVDIIEADETREAA